MTTNPFLYTCSRCQETMSVHILRGRQALCRADNQSSSFKLYQVVDARRALGLKVNESMAYAAMRSRLGDPDWKTPPLTDAIIPAVHNWPTNGDLIADVAQLHLQDIRVLLDVTHGLGTWWTKYQPPVLIANDIDSELDTAHHHDFRALPWVSHSFDAVAFDPPYKMVGTPSLTEFDSRYGLDTLSWQDRLQMILDGFTECVRVSRKVVLAKCQDQVVSGKIRWQSLLLAQRGEDLGMRLVDRFDLLGGSRPQPPGRRQIHARGRGSTLLVFRWD